MVVHLIDRAAIHIGGHPMSGDPMVRRRNGEAFVHTPASLFTGLAHQPVTILHGEDTALREPIDC
jgi:hypothetical protein